MSSEDLELNVPLRAFNDFIFCTVCMTRMQKCHLTPCGHRFCEKCIKEWVSRKHKCPCCNGKVEATQLVKDLQFDALIGTLEVEKHKSEKTYFNHLVSATASVQSGDNTVLENHFSPVELVLKNHIKKSLASHEKYYQDLKEDYTRRKRQIELELNNCLEVLPSKTMSQHEMDTERERLKTVSEEQTQKLHADMTTCGNMVAQAYDKYLTEHIPSLSVLPVSVSICMLSKKYTIPHVLVKPQDSLPEFTEEIKSHFSGLNDSVVNMDANLIFVCFGPLSQLNCDEMTEKVRHLVQDNVTHPDVLPLPPGCRPVLQHQIKPGSTIAVYGRIECESDQPKQCVVTTFQQDNPLPVDYFTCTTCGFNWICRSCMAVCHKNHQIIPYILNHQPNWPCCYCVKKKKCTLVT